MKLKIRCDYKAHKLQVTSDMYHIRLVMLIMEVFTGPKPSRFLFLMGLSCLLVLLLGSAQLPAFYTQYAPVVLPATAILSCTICKQGPPTFTTEGNHEEHYKQKLIINILFQEEINDLYT